MQPVPDLVKGIEVLQPFLDEHHFLFNKYENIQGSGGLVSTAFFVRENKTFVIGYRYSVGELYYQFKEFRVGHSFYLDHFGHKDQKQFPDFQSEDKLLAFRHILHDFHFLVDDFFEGSCAGLIEASRQQQAFIDEYNRNVQTDYKYSSDRIIIDEARQNFKDKQYRECLQNFDRVIRKKWLAQYDTKIIDYCKKHLL